MPNKKIKIVRVPLTGLWQKAIAFFSSLFTSVVFKGRIMGYFDNIAEAAFKENENGETINELTDRFIQAMHEDCDALNVMPPDIEPRATTSMQEIIDMIKTLEEKSFTYTASNGDIYYDVGKFKPYGALSGSDVRCGTRADRLPGMPYAA